MNMNKGRNDLQDMYYLTPMQEGMLFHYLMDRKSQAYFQQNILNLRGELDRGMLEKSFNVMIARHDILRTLFLFEGVKKPVQAVLKSRHVNIGFTDISGENDMEIHLDQILATDRKKGFDLAGDCPVRLFMIKVADQDYRLVWSFHHILMDGWSLGIFIKELFSVYAHAKERNGYINKKNLDRELGECLPYGKYIQWLESRNRESSKVFWRNYLAGYEQRIELPKQNRVQSGYIPEQRELILDEALSGRLRKIAYKQQTSLSTLMQLIWGILLMHYNETDDVAFGYVVAGRPLEIEGIERVLGLFINTVPVRIQAGGEMQWSEVLKKLQEEILAAKPHDYLSLAEIQAVTQQKQELLDHILIFENYPLESGTIDGQSGLCLEDFKAYEQTPYPFNLFIIPEKAIRIQFRYNGFVYSRDMIGRLTGHLETIARALADHPEARLKEIEMLREEEIQQLVVDFNRTGREYPRHKTIHQLFHEQAEKTPQHTALIHNEKVMSYRELDRLSGGLANTLRERGVKTGSIVGLMVKRSPRMFAGLLGILKAGGAYLPIDPEFPAERIRYMLSDSGVKFLLTESSINTVVSAGMVSIDLADEAVYCSGNLIEQTQAIDSTELAYVIYTSGSTGRPKGVMIEHRPVVNLLFGITDRIQYTEKKTILALTTVSFDIFVLETLLPLMTGMQVVIAGEEAQKDILALSTLLKKHPVKMLQCTPSRAVSLLELPEGRECLRNLTELMVGGEALPQSVLTALKQATNARIYNMYGPTETTVWSSVSDLTETDEVSLGSPIINTRMYILDRYLRPAAMGTTGELYIGGDGLSRGYLHKPELTAERFVADPFTVGQGGPVKMYRTGDLASRLADGQIRFIGRADGQVKVRGYRVELGEIEDALLKHKGVKEAAVVARADGNGSSMLCAYFVSEEELAGSELREHLLHILPAYMLPSFYTRLERLPLTANNKVDRKVLPVPDRCTGGEADYEAPVGETELRLAHLWQEILGVTKIGRRDNFFLRGGDSIKAIQLLSRLMKYGLTLEMKALFAHPEIRELAPYVRDKKAAAVDPELNGISPAEALAVQNSLPGSHERKIQDIYYLTPLQEGMLFHYAFNRESPAYFEQIVFTLKGDLEPGLLEQSFNRIIRRHDILRTVFVWEGLTKPVQVVYSDLTKQIPFIPCGNFTDDSEQESKIKELLAAERQQGFDLRQDSAVRISVVQTAPREYRILWSYHHILLDGWCLGILARELFSVYTRLKNHEAALLPPKSPGYGLYIRWLQHQDREKAREYWKNYLAGCCRKAGLPGMRQENEGYMLSEHEGVLDEQLTKQLKQLAGKCQATFNTLIQFIWGILLIQYNETEDVVFGRVVAGRPPEIEGIEEIVGLFINTIPIRIQGSADVRLDHLIHAVQEELLTAKPYEFFSLAEIQAETALKQELLDHILIFEDFPVINRVTETGFILENFQVYEQTNYDFNLYIISGRETRLKFRYNEVVYRPDMVAGLAGHLETIARSIVAHPEARLKDLELLTEEEKQQLLYHSNRTGSAYPRRDTRLERQAIAADNRTGKTVLSVPDSYISHEAAYEAPEGETEQRLARLWQEVLAITQPGRRENFFELGGHSLKAMTLIARLHKELNIRIPLNVLFSHPTIKETAEYLGKMGQTEQQDGFDPIGPAAIRPYYPVTPGQKRLYVLKQLEEDSTVYNMGGAMVIEGKLSRERLEANCRHLIQRHEILRTSLHFIDGEPVQQVHDDVPFEVVYLEEPEEKVNERLRTFIRPFNLEQAPLFRVLLIRLAAEKHLLVFDLHHIISDGVSVNILIKEFQALYNGKSLTLPRIQYKDFTIWQKGRMEEDAFKAHEAYWRGIFAGEIPVLDLPADYPRPAVQSFAGARLQFAIDPETTRKLYALAGETGATIFMILLAVYNTLLMRYTGQEDVIVGSPAAGRSHADTEAMPGMFVNTLALRNYPRGQMRFGELIDAVKQNVLGAFAHQSFPFEKLVENLDLPRDKSRNPLFDVMFVMQNMDNEALQADGLKFKPYPLEYNSAKFDLLFSAIELDETLGMAIEYATRLFSEETVRRMAGHFCRLLQAGVTDPSLRLNEMEMLTAEERKKLLYGWNNTQAPFPDDRTIHGLFEEQAEKMPEKIAVMLDNKQLSYDELNRRANQVARVLRRYNVKSGSIVGLLAERSLEMITGIMGILKAGGAYLPVDPGYPAERIRFMLEDSSAQAVLTGNLPGITNPALSVPVINLADETIYQEDGSNLEPVNQSNDLAYIIYTSGSTGQPKGVMIEHRSLINRLHWMQRKYPIGPGDIILQKTPCTFDVSVWELFWWSMTGAALYFLKPGGEKEPEEIADAVRRKGITTLHFVPSMLQAFLEYIDGSDLSSLKTLRQVFASGETLTVQQVKRFNRLLYQAHGTRLYNLYGPTEATVDVSYFDCPVEGEADRIPIGRPIDNIQLYILNGNQKLQAVGIPGELFIGGAGLARGYLNRPELTAEKFISYPSDLIEKGRPDPAARLYRTGDWARRLPDGNIEFLGRLDHQVKIRGNRIELGEIEAVLLKHTAIQEAVVTVHAEPDGNNCLSAYIVSGFALDIHEIRTHLSRTLPDYMIPSVFIPLEHLPLTSNGKIDRKALPQPREGFSGGMTATAPANDLEKWLAEIWQQVLDCRQIGTNFGFFQLGGDSIKAIHLVSRLNKTFGIRLKIRDIYRHQTIKDLSEYLRHAEPRDDTEDLARGLAVIEERKKEILNDPQRSGKLPQDAEDFFPLSRIQQSMVFFSRLKPAEPIYHDQFPYQFALERFDLKVFRKALQKMVQKHPILRTTFNLEDFGEPMQLVHQADSQQMPLVEMDDLSPFDHEEQERRVAFYLEQDLNNKFSFNNAWLWRIRVFKLSGNDYCIALSFQHAILDGWSTASFLTELFDIFYKLLDGNECRVQPLAASYKAYIALQLSRRDSGRVQEFWRNYLRGYTRNKLPFNLSNRRIKQLTGSRILRRKLPAELLRGLEHQTENFGCSVQEFCLAAYVYLMGLLSTENDVVTGVVTHDRPAVEESEKILGCFLNTVPLRVKVENEMNKTALIAAVKKNMREIRDHELFLGDIAAAAGESGGSMNPIFDCLHNFTDFHVLKELAAHPMIHAPDNPILIQSNEMTNTLMDLEVSRTLDLLSMQIKYTPCYFLDEDIRTAMDLYISILEEFAYGRSESLAGSRLISPSAYRKILHDYNNTAVAYPQEKTLHGLFEEQAAKTPENTALVWGSNVLCYRELNETANQWARLLRDKGIKPSNPVALICRRGFAMITGMLAILKCGGAYVPIDPEYPAARKQYLADNSQVTAVLADDGYDLKHENILLMDPSAIHGYQKENLNPAQSARDLAYIIYTSGSTGVPKGVMIEHHSAVNLICWVNREFKVNTDDSLLFITSMCFDLSVYDIFGILAAGGKVVIAGKEQVQDPMQLKRLLTEHRITFWDSVPSTMNYLVNALEQSGEDYVQPYLRQVFMSGDWIPVSLPDRLKKYFPGTRVISLGGATEGTVWSIYYPIETVDENWASIPYGKPLDNNCFYILDKNRQTVPRGVAGELYIGGAGVARGYINNPELTAQRFMPDPFYPALITSGKNSPAAATPVMYRTGDLGRMLPDGNIEFLGRADHQVKIRGYRVELGEIENSLLRHPAVKEAVAVDKTDAGGNKYLSAYFVSNAAVTGTELKEYLSGELPDYMIPAYFIALDRIPLTANGKIDRQALPEPGENQNPDTVYTAPRTALEEKLAGIWQVVLAVQPVGIHDNFFELGGHSLIATNLVLKIHKEMDVQIPLQEVFRRQTVAALAEYIEASAKNPYTGIKPADVRPYYPLSPAQKRLYILHRMDEQSTGYNMPGAVAIRGEPDLTRLEQTFHRLIQRHEALRTTFDTVDGAPVQRIRAEAEFKLELRDASEKTERKIMKDFIRPFDLKKAPLLRACLIRLEPGRYTLLYDLHHLISDGVSMGLLVNDFIRLYSGETLPPLSIHYKDYAVWQKETAGADFLVKQETYWQKTLQGEIPAIELPADNPRPDIQSFAGDRFAWEITGQLAEKIKTFPSRTGTTLYMVLLAAYTALLYKITRQEDIIIGTPIAGRGHAELEKIIGVFVNTLAMRNYPSGGKTFLELLNEVREQALQAYENQDYPFEAVVENLNLRRDMSRNPLFDTMLVLQNTGRPSRTEIPGLIFQEKELENKTSKFDLTLSAMEEEDKIAFRLDYNTSLFRRDTIERLAGYFINLLTVVTENPRILLKEICILSEAEVKKQLAKPKKTAYPRQITIQQQFEAQAEKHPGRTAVVFAGQALTYGELNAKANQLAARLRAMGLASGQAAGLMIERSVEMIIGILGILKAGGAYLPIDPHSPAARIEYMLQNSRVDILLTGQKQAGNLQCGKILNLKDNSLYYGNKENLPPVNTVEDAVYIIYTSGTTGQPKGVVIRHRNLSNLICGLHQDIYRHYKKTLSVALIAPLIFDASVKQIFAALLLGHCLHIAGEEARFSGEKLLKFYQEQGIDISDGTPIHLSLLAQTPGTGRIGVRQFLIGGEVLPYQTVKNFFTRFNDEKPVITNIYGPTECCVDSTGYTIDFDQLDPAVSIPIGKPLANTHIYILGKNLELLPKGVRGELCITGDSVGAGYINNPEAAREKFIQNPYQPEEILYRTGDLARWLPDGNIRFLGRMDHQVKIRGFRLEPGEVEARVLKYPTVREAVVTAREDAAGDKYLCAYVTADEPLETSAMRSSLSRSLPEYMLPSFFVQLEKLPLTPSGKIDRTALPDPDRNRNAGIVYEAPSTAVETSLASVWQEVLGQEKVGIHDNFFDLGGDSIKAIQVAARLYQQNLRVEVRDLLTQPTIKQLGGLTRTVISRIPQGIVSGEIPLTPIQHAFFRRNPAGLHHYNQAVMLYRKEGFNEAMLKQVFAKLTEHHDALRMVFTKEENRVVQYNKGLEGDLFHLAVYDLTDEQDIVNKIAGISAGLQERINLSRGPLIKLGLIKTAEADHLLIAIHHLVVDGVSWRILLEDFTNAYQQAQDNKEIKLPAKTHSYQDWAEYLLRYAGSNRLRKEIRYWTELGKEAIRSLPKDYATVKNRKKDGKSLSVSLNPEETQQLVKQVHRAYHTEINDLLLTALGLAMKEWLGREKIWIQLESHGRQETGEEINITRTVGWFTALFPVVLDLSSDHDLAYLIKLTKENLRRIPGKGLGYGVLRYLLPEESGIFRNDTPEISFNYLGQLDTAMGNGGISLSKYSPEPTVSGMAERRYTFDINCAVTGGRFTLTLEYNRHEYAEPTINGILNSFKKNLLRIIEHCLTCTEAELTPADLGGEELSLEEMESIMDFYTNLE